MIKVEGLAPFPILFISFTKAFMIYHYCREGKHRVVDHSGSLHQVDRVPIAWTNIRKSVSEWPKN